MSIRNRIRAEIERETRTSRRRNRVSRERVHPYQHDIDRLVDFVIDRRATQPGAIEAVRRIHKSVDIEAMRFLIGLVLEQGRSDLATKRRCERLLAHCRTVDRALLLGGTR